MDGKRTYFSFPPSSFVFRDSHAHHMSSLAMLPVSSHTLTLSRSHSSRIVYSWRPVSTISILTLAHCLQISSYLCYLFVSSHSVVTHGSVLCFVGWSAVTSHVRLFSLSMCNPICHSSHSHFQFLCFTLLLPLSRAFLSVVSLCFLYHLCLV